MRGNTKGVFETYIHFRVRDLVRSEPRLKYRNKEMEFELTEDDIQDMLNTQDYKCYYTGLAFEDAEGKRPSIDRINSNKGYTKDNVVITLGVINLMKRI